MPTQEEVLEFARQKKFFTLKELRQHFKMQHLKGSSHLSDRVKKLYQRGYLKKFKIPGGQVLYLVPPEHWGITIADEFLHIVRQLPTSRRRRYSEEILERINNALWDEYQSAWKVAKRAGVKVETAKRYLEHLVDQGIIMKFTIGNTDYYTVYSLEAIEKFRQQ